jgi:hypothetical protein
MASNQLLYESNKILKDFIFINSIANLNEIDRKRKKAIEASGRRFWYRDGYNPRFLTKNRVRNFLISEIQNATTIQIGIGTNGRVSGVEQSKQL